MQEQELTWDLIKELEIRNKLFLLIFSLREIRLLFI